MANLEKMKNFLMRQFSNFVKLKHNESNLVTSDTHVCLEGNLVVSKLFG